MCVCRHIKYNTKTKLGCVSDNHGVQLKNYSRCYRAIDLYRHEQSFQKSGLSRVRSSTEGKYIRADNKIECLLPLCSSSWALFSSAFCSSPDDWEESILQPVRRKMYGGGGWRREKEERVQVETDSKVECLDWAAGMRQYEGETERKKRGYERKSQW